MLSAAIGLDESTIRCGMRIMEQLGLVEYTLQPFRFQLIPSGKCRWKAACFARSCYR
ncbi:MAG: hypothetical protein ACLUI3_09700 [Christensenellales bacterium]